MTVPDDEEPTTRVEVQQYAEAVDPWAAAEAAAVAAGAKPSYEATPPDPGGTWTMLGSAAEPTAREPAHTAKEPPPTAEKPERTAKEPEPRGRRRGPVIGGVAGVLAAAVAVAATVYFWPRHPALDFTRAEQIRTITPVPPVSSAFVDSEVVGDRAYFASAGSDGVLSVVAADTGPGDRARWQRSAGKANSWESMTATPSIVVLFSGIDPLTSLKRMVVLDAEDGELLWEKPVSTYDDVLFGAGTVVWSDRTSKQLVGLGLTDGKQKWAEPDPDTSTIRPVLTPKDLSGPADPTGRLFSPDLGDDERFVQFDSDRTVTVRDMNSGKALQTRKNVASTSEKAVAYDGRLFVLETGTTKRIFRYDLANLEAEPATLHSAGSTDDIDWLIPCGRLLCFLQTPGYDSKSRKIYAVGDEGAWQKSAPGVGSLVPVGDRGVLANSDKESILFVDGKPAWTWQGFAVRLDAANVLRFNDRLSSSIEDRALSGVHVGDEAVELGLIRDVRSNTCSWNTSVVACVTEEQYVVYSFTE